MAGSGVNATLLPDPEGNRAPCTRTPVFIMYSGVPGENSHRRGAQRLHDPCFRRVVIVDPPSILTATVTPNDEGTSDGGRQRLG